MTVETAQGLLKQARSQLKKMERDLAVVRRLTAAAADELEKTHPTTDTQEGHRDDEDEDRRSERRDTARRAA